MLSNAYAAVSFACADDGIGKCDRSTLSQQALMELFIFGLNESEKICGSRDDPDDVCEWKGVTCNADRDIEKFEWINKHKDGTGTLVLEFLPWSMKLFRVCSNALSGTILWFSEPKYEKLHQVLLRKRRAVALSNSIVGACEGDCSVHF